MSKAFTDEESRDSAVLGRTVKRAAPGEERPITPEGHRALLAEVERLTREELPAARASGDDQRRAQVEHRLALATATLDSVRVVEAVPADGVVRFGSYVTLAWDDGRTQQLRLVGPDEADGKEGRVSVEAPLARVLLGQRQGDELEVERPRGAAVATIVLVK